jgi:hypothetical protein
MVTECSSDSVRLRVVASAAGSQYCAFSCDSALFAASWDGFRCVSVWRVSDQSRVATLNNHHFRPFLALCFSPINPRRAKKARRVGTADLNGIETCGWAPVCKGQARFVYSERHLKSRMSSRSQSMTCMLRRHYAQNRAEVSMTVKQPTIDRTMQPCRGQDGCAPRLSL